MDEISLATAVWNFDRVEDQRSEGDFLEELIVVEIQLAFAEDSIATVVGHVLCLVLFVVVDVIIFADHDIVENICKPRLFLAERSLSRINKSRYLRNAACNRSAVTLSSSSQKSKPNFSAPIFAEIGFIRIPSTDIFRPGNRLRAKFVPNRPFVNAYGLTAPLLQAQHLATNFQPLRRRICQNFAT